MDTVPHQSLWEATARPAPDTPPLSGDTSTDIAIVGGGFCGLSCALHLAERGIDTVLLEAQQVGWGASGRNGGQMIPCFKEDPDALVARHGPRLGEAMARLGAHGGDLVPALIKKYAIDCAFRRDGWILGVHSEAAMPGIRDRGRQWQARGRDVHVLGADDVKALTGTDLYVGGYLDPTAGALNPMSLARGLAEAAQGQGARIHGQSPALGIKKDSDGWRIDTPGGQLRARQVLIATGAYSGAAAPRLRRSILPMQSIQIATAPLPKEIRREILPQGHVVSDTRRLLLYFRGTEEGRFVFGGRGAIGGETIRASHIDRLEAAMRQSFPQLGTTPIAYHWAGQVDLTPDRRLRIHHSEDGLWSVIGFSGRGVAIAPAVGKALAKAIAAGTPRDLPLPVTPPRPLPLHWARRPAMSIAVGLSGLRDRWETR